MESPWEIMLEILSTSFKIFFALLSGTSPHVFSFFVVLCHFLVKVITTSSTLKEEQKTTWLNGLTWSLLVHPPPVPAFYTVSVKVSTSHDHLCSKHTTCRKSLMSLQSVLLFSKCCCLLVLPVPIRNGHSLENIPETYFHAIWS